MTPVPDMESLELALAAEPANAELHYLFGAELAQQNEYRRAAIEFGTAIHLAPHLHTARFQLGLLQLTMTEAQAAIATWEPLGVLAADSPLRLFKEGLVELIHDRFEPCLERLSHGIKKNQSNPALNADMQIIIDRVRRLMVDASASTPTATVVSTSAPPRAAPSLHTDFSKYGNDGGSTH